MLLPTRTSGEELIFPLAAPSSSITPYGTEREKMKKKTLLGNRKLDQMVKLVNSIE